MSIDDALAAIDALLGDVPDQWQCGCGAWHDVADILARGACVKCGCEPKTYKGWPQPGD